MWVLHRRKRTLEYLALAINCSSWNWLRILLLTSHMAWTHPTIRRPRSISYPVPIRWITKQIWWAALMDTLKICMWWEDFHETVMLQLKPEWYEKSTKRRKPQKNIAGVLGGCRIFLDLLENLGRGWPGAHMKATRVCVKLLLKGVDPLKLFFLIRLASSKTFFI